MVEQDTSHPNGRRRWWIVAATLAAVYLALTLPVVFSGRTGPSEAFDQDNHHLVVIQSMADGWPHIELVDYPSATSPGYHLVMSLVGRAASPEAPGSERAVLAMRVVNTLVSLGLLLGAWWGAARLTGPIAGAALVTPLLANSYFLGAAIFLTTDNAALCFVILAMTGLLRRDLGIAGGVGLGVAACAAVAVRQIHAWVAAPVGAACLLASPLRSLAPRWLRPDRTGPALPAMAPVGVIAGLAPLALLGWFVWLWGGLMPPAYVDLHNTGVNGATFAFAFALAGGLGVFLAPVAGLDLRRDLRCRLSIALAGVALVCALATPTDYALKHRAFGALWRIVEMTPAIGGRSVVLALGAPVGGLLLGAFWSAANRRGRGPASALLLLSMLGWALAQSFNSMAWQRYFEPFLLVMLAWLAAGARDRDDAGPRWLWAGPLSLAAIELALSGVSLYREVISS
ncbi:MAG: hypothetical protein ACF8QF_06170 [Phycisphaerales bacterium]